MLYYKQGRANTKRTTTEEQEYFKHLIQNLDDEEVEAFRAIVEGISEGDTTLLDVMTGAHYEYPPVPMEQFLDDDYYMGISAKTLYPKLRASLIEMFDDGRYSEVILGGSIGYGKTTAATFIAARVLYEMLCLRDPQMAYGLSPGSEVHFTLLSKNLHLARRVLMSAVMEKIRLSPWFVDLGFEEKSGEVHFPKNIVLQIGSVNSERVLGLNVYANVLDEANFMTGNTQVIKSGIGERAGVANYDRAEKVYTTIDRRIKSRFMSGGRTPGMNILISSKTTKNSFTERRIRESINNPFVYVMDYATWDVKPESAFSGKTFQVLVGSQTARSRIVEDDETIDPLFLDETGAFLIDVPVEYRKDFELDLNMSIRDVAGVSTEAIHAFIARQETIFDAITEDLVHPFSKHEWVYGTSGAFLWQTICDQYSRRLRGGHTEVAWKPKRNPDAPRHVHIDIALSGDSLGLAMGYISRWVEVMRHSPDGVVYSDLAPEYEIDFMLRVSPPRGDAIYLPDIRALVYELMAHGYKVNGFSCDQFQSAEMIQKMRAKGVPGDVISVDRTTGPYDLLKQALYEKRIRMYEYKPFLDEALALEYDSTKGKVDHPVGGGKDVTDAVAGVLEGLNRRALRQPMSITVGAHSNEDEDKDADGQWVLTGGLVPTEEPARGKSKGDSPLIPFILG